MTMNQKKALYAFGSPDREATVNRFCTLAEVAPDPAVKHFFLAIARELNAPTADRWYHYPVQRGRGHRQHTDLQCRTEKAAGRVQQEAPRPLPLGKILRPGRRDLCAGQVQTVYPAASTV